MDHLHLRQSMKDIARQTGASLSGGRAGVERGLVAAASDTATVAAGSVCPWPSLKGNTGGERFQCILTAPLQHKVFDILPSRNISTVQEYLKGFPNRNDVKAVVMDMNKGFRNVTKAFLPNTKIVVDRFHVVRYCTWAMDDVRRRLQQSLIPEKHFQRSRRLLLAHRDKLSEEDRLAVSVMLGFSDTLHQAYALKGKVLSVYGFSKQHGCRPTDLTTGWKLNGCSLSQSLRHAPECFATGSPISSTLSIFRLPTVLPRVATMPLKP